MRKLFSLLVLTLASAPAFAQFIPEPETYALLGIGAVGMYFARPKKNK